MNYEELLKTPQWRTKRQEVLHRDKNQCRNCSSGQNLQVHHRQYHYLESGEKVMPWRYANRYLITLCGDCHRTGHALYKVPSFLIHEPNVDMTETRIDKRNAA